MLDAGIVDQYVKLAVALHDVFERPARHLGVGDIEGHGLGADLGGCRIKLGGVAGVDNDRGAVLLERLGHGKPQAPRCAGDESHAALEGKHVFVDFHGCGTSPLSPIAEAAAASFLSLVQKRTPLVSFNEARRCASR